MSDNLRRIAELVECGQVRISDHGYDELAADQIFVKDLVGGISSATTVEVYLE